ncbi:MAG TPA: Fe(2+)-trafficking protein [Chloroflexota bacterium]|nr:Fe(2+)-trafficking protein [Chloroflexota bacterium]HZU06104.1 Fe(2+)-trafficking protein [Chloroflexota bacterium]
MGALTCCRCGLEAEPLPRPPLAGAIGQAIQAHVCPRCWREWQQAAPAFINHYGIQVVDPAQRAQLYALMREFLNLPADA